MEKVQMIVRLVEGRSAALAEVSRIEREIGRLVGEVGVEGASGSAPGKAPVAGPPTPAVLDGDRLAGVARPAAKRGIAEESLPKRLARLLSESPGKAFSADEAARALGEEPRKTHYSLLRRLSRKSGFRKAGRGRFAAVASRKASAARVARRSGS